MLALIADNLTVIRRWLLWSTIATAAANVIACSTLLAYQTILTSGYQESVPALLAVSFTSTVFPLFFLYSKPFAFGASSPASKRARFAVFLRSIAAELISYGGIGAYMLIATVDLHTSTPGLLSTCGGYVICRLLTCCLAVSCLNLLFLSLTFAAVLACTIYFSAKRHSAIPALTTSFSDVEWDRYAAHGRGTNRRKRAAQLKKEAEQGALKLREMEREQDQQRRAESVFVVMDAEDDAMSVAASVAGEPSPAANGGHRRTDSASVRERHSRGDSVVIGGAM